MAQGFSNKKNSGELFDAQSAIDADDAFLQDIEDGLKELQTFSDKHFEVEYHECCENTRHAERLRNIVMQFWATFCGILFVAIGASIGQLDCDTKSRSNLLRLITIRT